MSQKPWRVLVVDDSPDDRAEARRLLLLGSDMRYSFEEAETGAEAVRMALGGVAPDCMVVDYNLPDMEAPEVLAALCAATGVSVCPVVVLTGSSSAERGRLVLRAGAQDYISKDRLTAPGLTRAVENAIERWVLASELRDREARLRAVDAQLRRNHDTLSNLVQNDPFGIYVVDADFRLWQVSQGAQKVFENVRPLLGRDFDEVMRIVWPDPFATEVIARFRHTLDTGEAYAAPSTSEHRADIGQVEAYDWRIERVSLPDGRPGVVCYFYDLSERQRWLARLTESESFYRQTLESIPGMVFTSTPAGAWDYVSQAWLNFTGAAAAAHHGDGWLDLLHAEDRPRALASWRAAVESRGECDLEVRVRRADGAHEWFKLSGRGIRNAAGDVARWFGTAMNVDDLKQVEGALEARSRELQTLADNTPDILSRFDTELRHRFVNVAVEKATGRKREEFIGKTNREMGMPTAQSDASDAAVRRVFDTGQPTSIAFTSEGSGEPRHYTARLVPERGPDGLVQYVLGVTHDVTEQTRAEEQRRLGEERLRMALSAAGAGAWDWQLSTGEMTLSPENDELYGFGPAAGSTTYAEWEARIHPDDRARAHAAVRDAVERRTPEFRAEFRVVHPHDGTIRWLLGCGQVEFDASEKPVRMGGINLDITDRKRFEEALSESDKRKDEFLATLAHELRNPLAPLRTGLEVARLSPVGSAADKAREMMERQLRHMVRLIDDLMDVSRVSRGKIELRKERVAMSVIVRDAVEASRTLIDAGGHALVVELPSEPIWINGDLTRLAQVVSNLLNNAAKYTRPGGRIALTARVEADRAVVEVSDSGAGISADDLPKVFDLFAQVHRTVERAQGGLGIGLSLVKTLVALHGGSVTAESAGVGHGSRFTVRLPLHSADAQPGDGTGRVEKNMAQQQGRRILVVDDNVDGADMLATLLELSGHETATAYSGTEALSAAHALRPEVAFLDIGLPGMDGYELARRLRSAPEHGQAVLVALTGWGGEDDKRRSAEAGFDYHLTKPVDAAEVKALLAGLPARAVMRPPQG